MVQVGLELDDDVAAGLYHLRDNRNVDLSAWTAKVLEVLERTADRVVVRDTKPPWVKSAGE